MRAAGAHPAGHGARPRLLAEGHHQHQRRLEVSPLWNSRSFFDSSNVQPLVHGKHAVQRELRRRRHDQSQVLHQPQATGHRITSDR